MDRSESSRARRPARGLVGCGVLLAILAGIFALSLLVTARGHGDLMARWDATFGSWEAQLGRWPSRDVNVEALELERRSAAVGLDLAPRNSGRNPADPAAAAAFKALGADLKSYVLAAIESAERDVAPPPAALRAYLETYRAELDALRGRLNSGRGPRWQRRLEDRYMAPIPNLLGQLNVQRLLQADALAAVSEGDVARAHEDLEASWRLNQSLRDGPELISLLVALSSSRWRSGVLRLTPDPPEIWIERLERQPFLPEIVAALTVEGRLMTELPMTATAPSSSGAVGNAVRFAAEPYARMCSADLGEEYFERLQRLIALEWVCDRDLGAVGADLYWEPPWWNRLGDMALSNLSSSIQRAARADLDDELTARLLRLERQAGSGGWAGAPDPSAPSRVCPGDRWILEISDDGAAVFGLSRMPDWAVDQGPDFPQQYAESTTPAR